MHQSFTLLPLLGLPNRMPAGVANSIHMPLCQSLHQSDSQQVLTRQPMRQCASVIINGQGIVIRQPMHPTSACNRFIHFSHQTYQNVCC